MLLTKSPLLHSSLNLYLSFYLYRCIQLTYIQLSLASCSLYISLSPYPDHKISSPLSLTLYLYFSLYMWVSISECFSLCLCGFIYIYLSLFLTILVSQNFTFLFVFACYWNLSLNLFRSIRNKFHSHVPESCFTITIVLHFSRLKVR